MKWFKHYENAQTNNFLQALLSEKNGLELYAQYFLLLEFLCRDFKKDTKTFIVSNDQLKTALRVRQDKKLEKVLEVFNNFSETFDRNLLEISEVSGKTSGLSKKFWEIKTPIILELIGKDFKRTRADRGNATAKKENKNKNKNTIVVSEKTTVKSTDPDRVTPERIMNGWNKLADSNPIFSKVKVLSPTRKAKCLKAIKAIPEVSDWAKIINQVSANEFNLGKNNNGWVANFDWLFRNENYLKLLEEK